LPAETEKQKPKSKIMTNRQKLLTAAVFAVAGGLFWLFGPQDMITQMTGRGGGEAAGVDPEDKALVALGRTVYADNCAGCHGANLEGQPDWRVRNPDGTLKAPPHDETGHTWHHPDADMFRYIKFGGQAVAPKGFTSAMPGFEDSLSDREVWAVLSFIHGHWPAKVRERQRRLNEQSRGQSRR